MKIMSRLFFIFGLLYINSVFSLPLDDPKVKKFIHEMVEEHSFVSAELNQLFSKVTRSDNVLSAISKPAEKKLTWGEYRKIFLGEKRSLQGVEFWKVHRADLERAYQKYGVPPEIIIAILGIETRYGKFSGKYKVMDSLSTLAFYYPKRGKFFRQQLKEFLLLTKHQGIDPLSLTGSYAGAMGIPQFIPSSFRHYAIDFDNDNLIDIWSNPTDAIGSVANYFHAHKWMRDQETTIRASVTGNAHNDAPKNALKPTLSIYDLKEFNVSPSQNINNQSAYSLLELEQASGVEYWIGMHNFYVITRYNHSHLYAMAAYQLSENIKQKYLSEH